MKILVKSAEGHTCARCWQVVKEINEMNYVKGVRNN